MFGSRCRNADDIFVPRPLCRDAAARAPTRHQKKEKTGDRDAGDGLQPDASTEKKKGLTRDAWLRVTIKTMGRRHIN